MANKKKESATMRLVSSKKGADGKWYNTTCGFGIAQEGRIRIKLTSIPLPNSEGEVWLTLWERDE